MPPKHVVRGRGSSLNEALNDRALNLVQPGGSDARAWWGARLGDNIRSIGYVIGFTFNGDVNHPRSWRLDWDPVQGLHLNLGDNSMWLFTELPDPEGQSGRTPPLMVEAYYRSFFKKCGEPMPADILGNLRRAAAFASDARGGIRARVQNEGGDFATQWAIWCNQAENRDTALCLSRLEELGLNVHA